jgi:hypothetical protein
MPESPVSAAKKPAFSQAPAAPKALSLEEMQGLVKKNMQKAASILGGTVDGEPQVMDPKLLKSAQVEEGKQEIFPVAEQDKQQYLRSLLAKEPFAKSYVLFGGALKVAFKSRRVAENEQILQEHEHARDRHLAKMRQSLLGLELVRPGGAAQVSIDELEDVAYSAVCKNFSDFEDLCDELFKRANDPDFWTRTDGIS